MKERLIQFINSEGLRPAKFAEIMGIGASGVSHILSGRNKPNYDFIVKLLSRFPSLNPDWLILGQGKMYRADQGQISSHGSDHTISDFTLNDGHQKELFSQDEAFVNKAGKDYTPEKEAYEIKSEVTSETVIDKVIIIYSDGTFSNYTPSK